MLSFFFFFANRNTSDFLVTLIPSERGIILRSLTFETSIILHRVFYIAPCVLKERQYFNQNNSVLAPNSLSI